MSEETSKYVLDATCGSRMFWFDKNYEYATYMDNREVTEQAIWKSGKTQSVRYLNVHPDIVADFRNMPFEDNSFYHVVFDPPHLCSLKDNSWMAKKYGTLREEESWQELIHDGFWECMRVLKPYGTLVFKWNEGEIPVREIIKTIGAIPMYGNRSGKASKTHWMVFMKIPEIMEGNLR